MNIVNLINDENQLGIATTVLKNSNKNKRIDDGDNDIDNGDYYDDDSNNINDDDNEDMEMLIIMSYGLM